MLETYAEYGAIGVVIVLFGYMVLNLMASQKAQNEDLDDIRQDIAKMSSKIENLHTINIKLIDRHVRSDESAQRHREDMVKEMNDVTDSLSYIKGRMNGKG
tara:strand:- start:1302 stop:1604 length:303 start_codon:yes stop_codon:yes gene_type:complete